MNAQTDYNKAFEECWSDFKQHYAYFEEQGIDWEKIKTIYQTRITDIQNDKDFIRFLERLTHELHNGHTSLNVNLSSSNRIIPSGSDLFIEQRRNSYYIGDVRPNSKAAKVGLKPDMQLIKYNQKPIEEQLNQFLSLSTNNYTSAMKNYALNMLFAGTHNQKRSITTLENGQEKTYFPDREVATPSSTSVFDWHFINDSTAYIKINNSLGDNKLIEEFDKIIDSLIVRNTPSLVLDLTDTPSGGNTLVARAMIGRLITKELPYQKHQFNEQGIIRSWVEYVIPRKQAYTNKLILMVGHWTGSMGEGITIGLDGMNRAEIVGTPMAQLIGAIGTFQISDTNIGYQMPVERLYHINGTPREEFIPPHLTKNSKETWNRVLEMIGDEK